MSNKNDKNSYIDDLMAMIQNSVDSYSADAPESASADLPPKTADEAVELINRSMGVGAGTDQEEDAPSDQEPLAEEENVDSDGAEDIESDGLAEDIEAEDEEETDKDELPSDNDEDSALEEEADEELIFKALADGSDAEDTGEDDIIELPWDLDGDEEEIEEAVDASDEADTDGEENEIILLPWEELSEDEPDGESEEDTPSETSAEPDGGEDVALDETPKSDDYLAVEENSEEAVCDYTEEIAEETDDDTVIDKEEQPTDCHSITDGAEDDQEPLEASSPTEEYQTKGYAYDPPTSNKIDSPELSKYYSIKPEGEVYRENVVEDVGFVNEAAPVTYVPPVAVYLLAPDRSDFASGRRVKRYKVRPYRPKDIDCSNEFDSAHSLGLIEDVDGITSDASESGENAPGDGFEYKIKDPRAKKSDNVQEEFTSRDQIEQINRRYKKLGFASKLRTLCMAVILLLMLACEVIGVFGLDLGELFGMADFGALGVLVDLQLLALGMIIGYTVLESGVKAIIKRAPTGESCVAVMVAASLVYCIGVYISGADAYPLMCLPATVALALCLLSERIELIGEKKNFETVAFAGDKLAACTLSPEEASAVAAQVSSLITLEAPRVVRVGKTSFVKSFFARHRSAPDHRKEYTVLLIVISAFAVAVAIVSGIVAESAAAGLLALLLTVSLGMPIGVLICDSFALRCTEEGAIARRCAVIGRSSALEYGRTEMVTFEDIEAFPSENVKVKRVKLFGDNKLDIVLYNMASIFSVLGGPLNGVFGVSISEVGLSRDIRVSTVTGSGLVAYVDGEELMVGRGEFMEEYGIPLIYDSEDERQLARVGVSIMYAARSGKLSAKFYIKYEIDEDFVYSVKALAARSAFASIKTYDPNIDDRLLSRLGEISDHSVKVIGKKLSEIDSFASPEIDSGVISRSDSKKLLSTIISCMDYCRFSKVIRAVSALSAFVGLISAIVLVFSGLSLYVSSVYVIAYYALWVAPLIFCARRLSSADIDRTQTKG